MKKQSVQFDPSMKNGYIPAPYVLEEGDKITVSYATKSQTGVTPISRIE